MSSDNKPLWYIIIYWLVFRDPKKLLIRTFRSKGSCPPTPRELSNHLTGSTAYVMVNNNGWFCDSINSSTQMSQKVSRINSLSLRTKKWNLKMDPGTREKIDLQTSIFGDSSRMYIWGCNCNYYPLATWPWDHPHEVVGTAEMLLVNHLLACSDALRIQNLSKK